MEKKLLNVRELSAYLSMPTATVYAYCGRGKIPTDCIRRIGRSLKFDKLAVDVWINGGTSNNPGVSYPQSKKGTVPTSAPARRGVA